MINEDPNTSFINLTPKIVTLRIIHFSGSLNEPIIPILDIVYENSLRYTLEHLFIESHFDRTYGRSHHILYKNRRIYKILPHRLYRVFYLCGV